MILQALAAYYQRIAQEGKTQVAQEGFQKKEIPFIIVLDNEGHFRGLQDTREGEGKSKRARLFTVPHEIKRSGKNAWMSANLLWDNEGYVLGYSKKDTEKGKNQNQSFISRIKEVFPDPSVDEGIAAVVRFLERGDFSPVFSNSLWPEIEKKGGNISFQLEGDTVLVCQRESVIDAITNVKSEGKGDRQICLVSGELDEIARLHTAIKGVWGAQPSGANIVAINTLVSPAFGSYGKEQGYNAPVGKKAEFAYTTALNTLLTRGSRQRIQVGDASTVFWAAQAHQIEEVFADFLGRTGEAEPDSEAIKALYAAPKTGAPPLDDDLTPFYVLGLAPNAARIAIRFWYAGIVGEVAKHIRQHFDDCAIVRASWEPEHLSLFRLLVSTAVQGKAENIQPNLAGEVMKVILAGTPYPQTLLASVIRRVRAEREITYQRAALIKAVLARDARFYRGNEKEVGMSLDQSNTNPGYLLGRLFAVLERAQEEAAKPSKLNRTIRDSFYGAASSTPVAVFSHLLKLKNHHISKLESRGLAINLEKKIGEIMAGLNGFSPHLSLPDQGRFAVGYYHQRQDFFTRKDNNEPQ